MHNGEVMLYFNSLPTRNPGRLWMCQNTGAPGRSRVPQALKLPHLWLRPRGFYQNHPYPAGFCLRPPNPSGLKALLQRLRLFEKCAV